VARLIRTHHIRDLLAKVTKFSQPWVAILVRAIFGQPDAAEVGAQFGWVVAALEGKPPAAAEHLAAAGDDLLAFTAVPCEIRRQVSPEVRRAACIGRYMPVASCKPGYVL
jgi:putative transposase